jgi:hypothetical protein
MARGAFSPPARGRILDPEALIVDLKITLIFVTDFGHHLAEFIRRRKRRLHSWDAFFS